MAGKSLRAVWHGLDMIWVYAKANNISQITVDFDENDTIVTMIIKHRKDLSRIKSIGLWSSNK